MFSFASVTQLLLYSESFGNLQKQFTLLELAAQCYRSRRRKSPSSCSCTASVLQGSRISRVIAVCPNSNRCYCWSLSEPEGKIKEREAMHHRPKQLLSSNNKTLCPWRWTGRKTKYLGFFGSVPNSQNRRGYHFYNRGTVCFAHKPQFLMESETLSPSCASDVLQIVVQEWRNEFISFF